MIWSKKCKDFFVHGFSAFLFMGLASHAWAAPTQLPAPSVSSDTKFAYYRLNTTGFAAGTTFRILIDTDTSPTSGYGYGLGADYMLQNDTLYKHTGSGKLWNWVAIKKVNYLPSAGEVGWQVSLMDIDNPSMVIVRGQTPSPELASPLVTQVMKPRAGGINPFPTATASLPSNIVSGSTINLNCGTTYSGTLNLVNLVNVTVQTSGNCGPALITPVKRVTNAWRLYKDRIYVTDAPEEVGQVFVDGQHAELAHYPNSLREMGWLKPTNITATTMDYDGLQYLDLIGAKATFRGQYPWAIGTRTIAKVDGIRLTLPPPTNVNLIAENSEDLGKFYLEGKLWMLDAPGEWVWHDKKLYIYMPDGQAPGSRVHAGPLVNAVIDARGSTSIHLTNIRVVGGYIGVDASWTDKAARGASDLEIRSTEIAYSEWAGIYSTDSKDLYIDRSSIIGALHTGIYSRYGSSGTMVQNSTFRNINMIGMHKGSDGSIYLNWDEHGRVLNNVIENSGKSGIFMGGSKNAVIKGNKVDGACRIHGDCGGIYVFTRDYPNWVNTNTWIDSNNVMNVSGEPVRENSTNPERYGIYLDDEATGYTVNKNQISNCDSGMQMHLAYGNMISYNNFSNNNIRHVLLAESGGNKGSMTQNIFTGNTFNGPALPFFFAVSNPTTAATFSGNYFLGYGSAPLTEPAGIPLH